MKIYKLMNIPISETEIQNCIMKSENGLNSVFPIDESNRDYQEYLAWLAEGNTPEEAE